MKRVIFIALFLTACAAALSAQRGVQKEDRANRIKAYRVAVFTEILSLTPEEAEGFWPIFNAYQQQRDDLQKQLKPSSQVESMSDAEVEDYIKKHFELRQRELEMEKDLVQRLRKVLPVRKIAKIPVAEREFREGLIQKLKEQNAKRMERRPGNR
jgi:ADP-dependent phosphofructokinase/glucokinase